MSARPVDSYAVALACDLLADEMALKAWASAFSPDDALTLLILADSDDERASIEMRVRGLPGLTPAFAFRVLAPEDAGVQECVARALYLYAPAPRFGPWAAVPRVDQHTLDIVRFNIDHLRTPVTDYLEHGPHHPVHVTVGRHSYLSETPAPEFIAYAFGGEVAIGSFCSISNGVRFYLNGAHRMDTMSTSPLHVYGLPGPPGHAGGKGPIEIGHDVWIGHAASILSGVTIGTGAVVGTAAVVASDVRPYAVVVGNPAREVRRRFSDAECELLLESCWWELEDDLIRSALPEMWGSDVDAFVRRVRSLRALTTAPAGGATPDRESAWRVWTKRRRRGNI